MGLAGITPSLFAMLVYGGMMFFTAVILAREVTEKQDVNFDYPSLYERYLGKVGKYIATAASFRVTLYGSLAANGKQHFIDRTIIGVLGEDQTQII